MSLSSTLQGENFPISADEIPINIKAGPSTDWDYKSPGNLAASVWSQQTFDCVTALRVFSWKQPVWKLQKMNYAFGGLWIRLAWWQPLVTFSRLVFSPTSVHKTRRLEVIHFIMRMRFSCFFLQEVEGFLCSILNSLLRVRDWNSSILFSLACAKENTRENVCSRSSPLCCVDLPTPSWTMAAQLPVFNNKQTSTNKNVWQ